MQFVKPLDEKQVRDLLNDFERISYASRPKRVPKPINFRFEFSGNHSLPLSAGTAPRIVFSAITSDPPKRTSIFSYYLILRLDAEGRARKAVMCGRAW
jgi:hypothetical protein